MQRLRSHMATKGCDAGGLPHLDCHHAPGKRVKGAGMSCIESQALDATLTQHIDTAAAYGSRRAAENQVMRLE
jgi:hypothetical protein